MPTSDASNYAVAHAIAAYLGIIWIFISIAVILAVVCYWRIASKAGYSGILSLLMLLPFVNFIMLLYFAFSEWPIEQELRRVRDAASVPPGTSVMPT